MVWTMASPLLLVIFMTLFKGGIADNPCQHVDAGIRYYGTLYLFSGDKYIEINDDNAEESIADVSDWGDLPTNIDAAVQFPSNYQYYFFNGSEYYRYNTGGFLGGPWASAPYWDPFFQDGIDAAGNRLGVSHFFKECKYMVWYGDSRKKRSVEHKIHKRDVPEGLPCDIDAAWDLEDNWDDLVLVKDDKIWIWGEHLTGPFDLSEYYTITSWNICPAEEEEEE